MKFIGIFIGILLSLINVKAQYEGDNIIALNKSNFHEKVMENPQVSVVTFYSTTGNEDLSKEIILLSKKIRGYVQVGVVDCSSEENKILCSEEEVNEYPKINLYHPVAVEKDEKGFIKKKRTEYTGERKARKIFDFAISSIPSLVASLTKGETVTNTQINYDTFLQVKAFPKLVLVTNKPNTPILFRALSLEFLGRVILGEIPEKETQLIQLLNVTEFPTIFFFQPGSSTPILYKGEKNHDSIVKFINEIAIRPGTEKKEEKKEEPIYNPEPQEIKNQEELLKCINGYGICAISILAYEPEFEESVKKHKEELDILRELKESNHKASGPFKITWINSVEHGKKFIRDFDIPDMLPVFMIINGKKKLYRVDRGAFDVESINSFFKDVRNGRGRYSSYNFEPKLDNESNDNKEKVKDEL